MEINTQNVQMPSPFTSYEQDFDTPYIRNKEEADFISKVSELSFDELEDSVSQYSRKRSPSSKRKAEICKQAIGLNFYCRDLSDSSLESHYQCSCIVSKSPSTWISALSRDIAAEHCKLRAKYYMQNMQKSK